MSCKDQVNKDEDSLSVVEILEDLLNGDAEVDENVDTSNEKAPKSSVLKTFDFLGDVDSKTKKEDRQKEPVAPKNVCSTSLLSEPSEVHKGDTDSSDDEDRRYFEMRKYSDYGQEMKRMLSSKDREKEQLSNRSVWPKVAPAEKRKSFGELQSSLIKKGPKNAQAPSDVYTDPVFGLRMINPRVSSTMLKEKMQGRQAVPFHRIKFHVRNADASTDWVLGGIIVGKSGMKTSQKQLIAGGDVNLECIATTTGAQYSVWSLSDLQDGLRVVSLMLFGKATKDLWKTSVGTAITVLNPNILDNRNSNGEATLSVETAQKVLILGTSKDFGYCKSRKKNGEPCTAFVNLHRCEYCVYHLQQAYQKCAKRPELQSPNVGRGLTNLRNKVLGKSEVFYAGQSFMAVPAKKNKRLVENDNKRLKSLSQAYSSSLKVTQMAKSVGKEFGSPVQQKLKDTQLLQKLNGVSSLSSTVTVTPNESKGLVQTKLQISPASKSPAVANGLVEDLKAKGAILGAPVLGFGLNGSKVVDLGAPVNKVLAERAKNNAKKWVQMHGPIKKVDPNSIKSKDKKCSPVTVKPSAANTQDDVEIGPEQKKSKVEDLSSPKSLITSSRFKQLMEATSRHSELLEANEEVAQEEYFDKLEKKERIEEKMLTTYKIDCKAVQCLKCKYTAFSASDFCKTERHPLKVINAVKRFFKCANCGNRTATLNIIPLNTCKNCFGSHWERAPMLREKVHSTASLSIRGDEEKFLGSLQPGANLGLLVPDE